MQRRGRAGNGAISRRPVKNRSPHNLQIQQTPDAIGGVLATGAMPMDQCFHLAHVKICR